LHHRVYRDLKEFGLSAQPAIRTIAKVCDAYTKDKRVQHRFRPDAAQPYDARCLSWNLDQQSVSIWATGGRLQAVRFARAPWQLERLRAHRQGETDLLVRDGKWFLAATCEVPEAAVNESPVGFLGVDLGIVNIATTSDGERYAGSHLNRVRNRNRRLRGKLQKLGTKSAKRLLRKRNRREARFAKDVNHCISKRIVAEAERSGRGIALEDLKGHPWTGQGSQAPAGHAPLLGLRPTRQQHHLQSQPRRSAARVRRPAPHKPAMLRVRQHRQALAQEPVNLRMHLLRLR
jgi:putative transposase